MSYDNMKYKDDRSYTASLILFVCVGYGAPNASNNKENLMKMLHYPESATKNVSIAVG
jgi:hypothetical protein